MQDAKVATKIEILSQVNCISKQIIVDSRFNYACCSVSETQESFYKHKDYKEWCGTL